MAREIRAGEWNEAGAPPSRFWSDFDASLLVIVLLAMGLIFLACGTGGFVMFLFTPRLYRDLGRSMKDRRIHRRLESLREVLDLPGNEPVFPASIRLVRSGQVLGEDEGYFAFLDGWLVFNGLRTTFNLAAEDVQSHGEGHNDYMGLTSVHRLYIRLGIWQDSTIIGITPMFDKQGRMPLGPALDDFLRRRQGVEGIAVQPPRYPLPSWKARWRLLSTAAGWLRFRTVLLLPILAIGLWLVIAFGANPAVASLISVAVLVVIGVVYGATTVPIQRYRALLGFDRDRPTPVSLAACHNDRAGNCAADGR